MTMKPKAHLLALRLIQNAKDYLQALLTPEQLATLQTEVWEDALVEGVGDDLVALFCPPKAEERHHCIECSSLTTNASSICAVCTKLITANARNVFGGEGSTVRAGIVASGQSGGVPVYGTLLPAPIGKQDAGEYPVFTPPTDHPQE